MSDLLNGLVIESDLLTGLVSVRPTDRTGRGAAGRQRRARTLRTLAVRLSRRLLSHRHTGKLYTPRHSSKYRTHDHTDKQHVQVGCKQ